MSVWDFLIVFAVGLFLGVTIGMLFAYIELKRIQEESQNGDDLPEPFDEEVKK